MSENIVWSNSAVSALRQCNRKYYFGYVLANHGRKDKLRRKAFELKQMQNLQMWQGSIVDKIVEKHIIPDILAKNELNFDLYVDLALELAERRFQFSEEQQYLNTDLNKTMAGDDYCILDIHEIGAHWKDSDIAVAFSNIKRSILNIPDIMMPGNNLRLLDYLKECNSLLPNVSNWQVFIESAIVKPQIDLIVYDKLWKPAVIDWKVSQSFVSNYSKQLIIIGMVIYLKRLEKPEKKPFDYSEIKLYEVNLLGAEVKEHMLTEESVADMVDFINLTSSDIKLLRSNSEDSLSDIQDFDTTDNLLSCKFCNYSKLCSYMIQNKYQYYEDAYSKFLQADQFAES